ncbi:Os11g0183200, partial [Oryza sativa Japonica Group]
TATATSQIGRAKLLPSPFRPPRLFPSLADWFPGCASLGNIFFRRRRSLSTTGAPAPLLSLSSVFGWKKKQKERGYGRKKKRKRKEKNLPDRVYFILDGNLWYFEHRIIRLPISDLFALEQGRKKGGREGLLKIRCRTSSSRAVLRSTMARRRR